MRRSGFTLVEMLVVICIIGILAALIAVWFVEIGVRAKNVATRSLIHTLDAGCSDYRMEFGQAPPSTTYAGSQNLHYYLAQPWPVVRNGIATNVGPFINFPVGWLAPGASSHPSPPSFVYDKFNQPIEYVSPGVQVPTGVDIWSKGRSASDSTDDLSNWQQDF